MVGEQLGVKVSYQGLAQTVQNEKEKDKLKRKDVEFQVQKMNHKK